jgi:hypothetical protein
VFVDRALQRVFGPKGANVTGGWRKLRKKKEFHNLYILFAKYNYNGQDKEVKVEIAYSTNVEQRNTHRILTGNPEGMRQVGR